MNKLQELNSKLESLEIKKREAQEEADDYQREIFDVEDEIKSVEKYLDEGYDRKKDEEVEQKAIDTRREYKWVI